MLATKSPASSLLQKKQKDSLLRILSFNSEKFYDSTTLNSKEWDGQWKILIYDHFGRDIISPLLKVNELRQKGITLHLLIDADRDEILDVPAIYFIAPTKQNLDYILNDAKSRRYAALHLNFIYPIEKSDLEYLAAKAVELDCTSMIAKIYDEYLNYIALEPTLFSLRMSQSYVRYNSPACTSEEIDSYLQQVTSGLFSVFATLNMLPIIRCVNSPSSPCTMIAKLLDRRFREALQAQVVGGSNLFQEELYQTLQRPVLVLIDRNEDLASPLHHASTYQAIVDDLLGIRMNRVKTTISNKEPSENHGTKEKVYDLDVNTDPFFCRYSTDLLPDAIAANEEEMRLVTKAEEEIRAHAKTTPSVEENNDGHGANSLAAAVETLPELLEKKKLLETHTNIFHATFNHVTERSIPSFSLLEQKITERNGSLDKNEIYQLVSNKDTGGTPNDKLRLLLIYFLLSTESIQKIKEYEDLILSSVDANEQMKYKETYRNIWKNIQQHRTLHIQQKVENEKMTNPRVSDKSTTKWKDIAGVFAGHAQDWIQQAATTVKNFIPETTKLHCTRVAESLIEMKGVGADENYLYLDPKVPSTVKDIPKPKKLFEAAVVFVIGGGNYNEYHNLKAYSHQQQTHKTVIYGSTEIIRPDDFLAQLSAL